MVTIKIGVISDYSGPSATAFVPMSAAVTDYVRWVNEEDPIPRVRLETLEWDNKFDPNRATEGYEWLEAQGIKIVASMGTHDGEVIKPLAEADHIALLNGACSRPLYDPPSRYCYTGGVAFGYQLNTLLNWISENWDYTMGKPKIGMSGWELFHAVDVEKALRGYCQAHSDKFDYIGSSLAPVGTQSWPDQCEQMKDCDYIELIASGMGLMSFMREFRGKGYNATFCSDAAISGFWGTIRSQMTPQELDGTILVMEFPRWGPLTKGAEELLYKYHPAAEANEWKKEGNGYCIMHSVAKLWMKIVREAVREVGAEYFNGDAFADMAEKVSLDFEGVGTFNYTAERHFSRDVTAIYQYQANLDDIVMISDWLPLVKE